MNRADAKKLLVLYRSEKLDAHAPGMPEALQLAREDAELAALLEESGRFHSHLKGAFTSLPVPSNLRDEILAGRKVVPLWSRAQFFGVIAASIALLAGGSMIWNHLSAPQRRLVHFQNRMMEYAVKSYGMDIRTNSLQEVQRFLAQKGAPSQLALQDNAFPVIGGAKLSWQNRPVSMVCFKVKDKTAYLFVVDGSELAAQSLLSPRFGSHEPLSKATWSAQGQVYLLGAELPESELREIVSRLAG